MLDYSKCIKLISTSFKDFKNNFAKEKEQIRNLIDTIKKIDLKWIKNAYQSNFSEKVEILQPVENEIIVEDKKLTLGPINDLKENKWAFDLIKEKSVLGIDTSELFTTHYYPFFVLLNVGICYYNYKKNEYFETSSPSIYSKDTIEYVEDDRSMPLVINRLRLENELQTITDLIKEKSINECFTFFDESFSSNYLRSSNRSVIESIASNLKKNLDSYINFGLYPIGVIYTLSRGFVNFLKNVLDIKDINISDKQIFNELLKSGQRSCIFKVNNLVTNIGGLSIFAFYLKISENNVLRIEFDERIKEYADEISKIVFLQSVIGGGYPLCMQRAHELAYISQEERIYIYNLIEEELIKQGVKLNEFGFTRKQERKIERII